MADTYHPASELRNDGVALGLIAAVLLLGLLLWPHLPARVPIHWTAAGRANGWSSRAFAVFFLPAMSAALWLLLVFLPAVDPRRQNYTQFLGVYRVMRLAVVALLAVIQTLVLAAALGHAVPIPVVVPLLVSALLLVVGNLLPRLRPSRFVGIRTPWTLSSDEIWRRTHRLGGRLMMAGAVLPLLGVLGSRQALVFLTLIGVLAPCLVAMVYSWVVYQRVARGRDA